MLSKQFQVNRSGRQRHAAWGMSQRSDKWSVQYEMGMFCFFFYKIAFIGKLVVERQTGLQPESDCGRCSDVVYASTIWHLGCLEWTH